jgi:hypothetical protein
VRSTTFLFNTLCTSIQNFGVFPFQMVPVELFWSLRRDVTLARTPGARDVPCGARRLGVRAMPTRLPEAPHTPSPGRTHPKPPQDPPTRHVPCRPVTSCTQCRRDQRTVACLLCRACLPRPAIVQMTLTPGVLDDEPPLVLPGYKAARRASSLTHSVAAPLGTPPSPSCPFRALAQPNNVPSSSPLQYPSSPCSL